MARTTSSIMPDRGKLTERPFNCTRSSAGPTPSFENCPPNRSMSFTSTTRPTPRRDACTATATADSLPPATSRSASMLCAGRVAPAATAQVIAAQQKICFI